MQWEATPLPLLKKKTPALLNMLVVVTDRKIYQPGQDAIIMIAAPSFSEQEMDIEVQIAGQKIYEANNN